ncbi:hypothetical protein pb186bvf_004997 [Paramecium bursaria]
MFIFQLLYTNFLLNNNSIQDQNNSNDEICPKKVVQFKTEKSNLDFTKPVNDNLALSILIIDRFSIFLEQEFIQKSILKSILSTLSILVGETAEFGKIGYYKFLAEKYVLQNLYDFQIGNNITSTQILDNCLQTPHSQQFYSYQYCYGVYGNKSDEQKFQTIKTYISLQNQFTPFNRNELFVAQYNVYLDEQIFFSQYKGEYMKVLNQDIEEAVNILINYKLPFYAKQIQSNLLIFQTFAGSNIATGVLYEATQQLYFKTIKQDQFLNQRQIILTISGDIISDSYNSYPVGTQFYNSSITGFNIKQFTKVMQFSNKNQSVENECQQLFQDQILCLVDANQQEKILFSKLIWNSGFLNIFIVIIETKPITQIKEQFIYQLKAFFERQIQLISGLFLAGLILCLILQLVLIKRLNKPLLILQNLAKYHMNINQYQMQRIIRITKIQSQIQKLSDAFFDLIDNNKVIRQTKLQKNNIRETTIQVGIIQQRYEIIRMKLLRNFQFEYYKKIKFYLFLQENYFNCLKQSKDSQIFNLSLVEQVTYNLNAIIYSNSVQKFDIFNKLNFIASINLYFQHDIVKIIKNIFVQHFSLVEKTEQSEKTSQRKYIKIIYLINHLVFQRKF